ETEPDRAVPALELDDLAIPQSARPRILWMEDALGLARAAAKGDHARPCGVSLEIARSREEAEWEARGRGRLLGVGDPIGHGWQPLRRQRLRVELELPRRRRESLMPRLGGELDRSSRAQILHVHLRRGRARTTEELAQETVGVHGEDGIREAEPLAQLLGQPRVRPRLALRRHD